MLPAHGRILTRALRVWNKSCASYQCVARQSTLPSNLIVFQDNEMIVCWHPEPQYPYEYTKPIPKVDVRLQDSSEAPLCIGEKEITEVFKYKRPEVVVQELSKITYTTKHRWYPRARDKFAKKTEPDRPYL